MYKSFEMEADGVKCMTLVNHTVVSHKHICTNLGIFDTYEEVVASGGIGGEDEDESKTHLLGRFLNSAARTQVIACIEEGDCQEIAIEILGLLNDGHIYVIDIAAGHGAGTMSIINTICQMRESGTLTTEALDIEIHAIDFSLTSLKYYSDLLDSLSDAYLKCGIRTKLVSHQVDITNDVQVQSTIERIKKSVQDAPAEGVGADPRYLLICSAISGVKKSVFLQEFSGSYKVIAQSFKDKNSAFLWVEPLTRKDWMPSHWREFYASLKEIPEENDDTTKHMVKQGYHWIDPHLNSKLETAGDYFLMNLAQS